MIKKSRLRWFGHVERKDDNDWVRRYMTCKVEGIRQRGRPKKTWCVKNDMESLGLSQKDSQSRNKWRRRIKGQPANPGSPGDWLLKSREGGVIAGGQNCGWPWPPAGYALGV